jgi:hypothetical protein
MNIKDVAFLSVGFGDSRYLEQIETLRSSILSIYEDANLFLWSNSYPKTSKTYEESNYGFKVHAVQEALDKGFKKIFWLDAAMILVKKELEFYEELSNKYPVVVVKDDNKLINFISQESKYYFGIDDNWLSEKDAHLVGGSFYYFDFEKDLTKKIFKLWQDSERDGIFGSSYENIGNHRQDETCMALSLYKNETSPTPYYETRYNWCDNPIFIKKHFK